MRLGDLPEDLQAEQIGGDQSLPFGNANAGQIQNARSIDAQTNTRQGGPDSPAFVVSTFDSRPPGSTALNYMVHVELVTPP